MTTVIRAEAHPGRPAPGIWIAVFLLGMCALLNLYTTQPILKELASWGDVPDATAARTISATTIGVAIMAPIAGSFSDRVGRKRVVVVALIVMMAATIACIAAPNFTWLLIGRFLQGVATPFVFGVTVAYIGDEFTGSTAVALNSVYVAGNAFGGFSGRLLSGLAVHIFGSWQSSFLVMAVVLGSILAATVTLLPTEQRFSSSPSIQSGMKGIWQHLHDWRLVSTCLIGAVLLYQQVVSFTFGSLRLQESPFSLSPLQVGWVFVVFLAPVITTPIVGRMINRFGRVTTFQVVSVAGVAGLALTLIPTIWAMILGLMLSCMSVLAGQACATGFTASHATIHRSAAVGVYLSSYYLGGTLGGVAPVNLYATHDWIACVLMVIAIMIVAMAVAAIAWRPVDSAIATS